MDSHPPESIFTLPRTIFFGRTLAEYEQMFSFKIAELKGKQILDCPSGPASFVAEAHDWGIDVLGCDPLYQDQSASQLYEQAKSDITSSLSQAAQKRDQFSTLNDEEFEAYCQAKLEAMERFAVDFADNPQAYTSASLPLLPFAGDRFDWTLTAHFLFAYSSLESGGVLPHSPFDLEFHHQAIQELIRVTREQVRFYPIYTHSPPRRRHDYIGPVVEKLQSEGHQVEFLPCTYNQGSPIENYTMVVTKSRLSS